MTSIITALLAIFVLIFIVSGLVRPSDREVRRFAKIYTVPLTTRNVPTIRSTIQRSRRFRLLGALVAWLAGLALTLTTEVEPGWTLLLAGYVLGAVVAQLTSPRPPTQKARLERRSVTDYVRPWLVGLASLTSLGAVAMTIRRAINGGSGTVYGVELSATSVVAVSIGLLAFIGLCAVIVNQVVDQPAPTVGPDVDAAMHAARSASLMSIFGIIVMTSTATIGAATSVVGTESIEGLSLYALIVSWFLGIVGFFLSVRSLPRFLPNFDLPDMPVQGVVNLTETEATGSDGTPDLGTLPGSTGVNGAPA